MNRKITAMTGEQAIRLEQDLREIRRILCQKLHGQKVRIYLFGSRACGDARETSDIDIAILPCEFLLPELLSEIREALEESRIPFQVDLVNLAETDHAFRERILKEGILWLDF